MKCFNCGKEITKLSRSPFSIFCSEECEKTFAKEYGELVDTLEVKLPDSYLDDISQAENIEEVIT